MISYKEKDVWANDDLLLIIIFYLRKLINVKLKNNLIEADYKKWFEGYEEQFKYYQLGFSAGAIDFNFDNIPECSYYFNEIIDLLKTIRLIIFLKGESFNVEELNIIESEKVDNKVIWSESLETSKVVNILNDILKILEK